MAKKKIKKKEIEPKETETELSASKKSRIERLNIWRKRVERAKKIRTDWEREYQVKECERFFLGKQRNQGDEETIVLNHFWATLQAEKPNLLLATPKFYVRPKPGKESPEEESSAMIGEGVLSAIAEQKHNLKQSSTLALLQAFFRIGVIKTIYNPKLEPNPNVGEFVYASDPAGNPIFEKDEISGGVLQGPKGPIKKKVVDEDTGKPLIEPKKIVRSDAYRWQWVNAKNMLLPDEGPDQTTWTWLGEEIVVDFEDAKDDDRFSHTSKLVANEKPKDNQPATDKSTPDEEKLRYYECYDIKNKKIRVFADGQPFDDFLLEEDLPDGIEDHPYAILLGWTPIIMPEPSPWPFPHTNPWLGPQEEYNTRRRQIMEGAKRSARKLGFDDNTFPDEEEAFKHLQSAKDLEGVKLNDTTKPPITMEAPNLNPAIYNDIPLLQTDWRMITGLSGAKLMNPDANTATEATFVERASNLRDVDMQDAVQLWLAQAGEKMLQLVSKTLTIDMFIKLRGFSDSESQKYLQAIYGIPSEMFQFYPELKELVRERYGKEKWHAITRDDLQFESEVSVVPGSMRPPNLDVERDQWLKFLQILGQFPQLALSRELLKQTAKKFEYISERALDELAALAQKMIDVNARQAGRDQPGAQGGEGETGGAQNGRGEQIKAALMRMAQ